MSDDYPIVTALYHGMVDIYDGEDSVEVPFNKLRGLIEKLEQIERDGPPYISDIVKRTGELR
jgi:hypothetical protein